MKDFTQSTSEELYAILKAGTKLYGAEEIEAVQNELRSRELAVSMEVQSRELEGGTLTVDGEPTGKINIAWGLLVVATVLFIFNTMSANIQYSLATTGIAGDSAQMINVLFICVYVVAIVVIIAHVLGRDHSYKALWIIGGILLTKWVLLGLWVYSMATPVKVSERSLTAEDGTQQYKRYKD